MAMINPVEQEFADPTDPFRVEQARLARRRALAKSLIEQAASPAEQGGYQGGKVFLVGSPVGQIARSIGGAIENSRVDDASTELQQRMGQAQSDWQQQYAAAPDDQTRQQLLVEARNKGLRYDLEREFQKEEAARIERGEQLAADRVAKAEEAERTRIEKGEQAAADRVAREDLRRMPTTHITVSGGGGGGGAAGFGGAAPVIGADEAGNPIYRHTKSGKLFQYGEIGEPVPYTGKVGAKPAADKPLNENQGNAVLYGARAGEADKVMAKVGTDYSTIKTDMAHATTNTPGVGSLVNAGLSAKEQQVVQAQRDFVNAIMRRESGAAISPSEFANARKQYFPQPGDSDEVLAQKAANRQLVIKGLAEVSGPTGKKAIEAITPKTPAQPAASGTKPTVVRTGKDASGRKVEQLSDGSVRYAN